MEENSVKVRKPSKLSLAWSSVSLRTRLTSISVGLIALLLAISVSGTIALLKTYLQQNTDDILILTAKTIVLEDPTTVEARLQTHEITLPALPSDYYIAFLDPQGRLYLGLVSSTTMTPDVPNFSQFNVPAVKATQGIPFTADVPQGKKNIEQRWRLVALVSNELTGSVVVGIPMAQNEAIVEQYKVIGFGFSGLLLLISGLALWLTISSALRPLREVSAAADSVRAGKLDSRLPQVAGNTEIANLNRSLNEMLDSVEGSLKSRNQTLERMKQFVADASHELRTPLVTLRGYAELYRKGVIKDKDQIDDAMNRIESEAIRMSELVESLLALARLDNDAKLNITEGSISSVVESVVTNIQTGHQEAKFSVTDLTGNQLKENIDWKFDEAAIRQVLTNILNNAYVFAGEKPIEVAIGKNNGNLILEVIDHGDGIPKELRAKIFERFFRSDNSRNRDTGGSGLGLAIAKGLVEAHTGTIDAVETPGGGATFRITLPNK